MIRAELCSSLLRSQCLSLSHSLSLSVQSVSACLVLLVCLSRVVPGPEELGSDLISHREKLLFFSARSCCWLRISASFAKLSTPIDHIKGGGDTDIRI